MVPQSFKTNGESQMINLRTRIVLTGLFAASLSFLSAAAPANAADPVILDVGTGHLLAKGAAAEVPVTFICDPDSVDTLINLEVDQKVSQGRSALGGGSVVGFVCTGGTQTITIQVGISPRLGIPYKNGIAVARVVLQACSSEGVCITTNDIREIFLKNK